MWGGLKEGGEEGGESQSKMHVSPLTRCGVWSVDMNLPLGNHSPPIQLPLAATVFKVINLHPDTKRL